MLNRAALLASPAKVAVVTCSWRIQEAILEYQRLYPSSTNPPVDQAIRWSVSLHLELVCCLGSAIS